MDAGLSGLPAAGRLGMTSEEWHAPWKQARFVKEEERRHIRFAQCRQAAALQKMMERLQKIMAGSGIASRRKAEEMIAAGRVTLNGIVVTEQGRKADPERDEICVDGKRLRKAERLIYFLLNKPKGYVTTVSDPEGRPTVMDLLPQGVGRVYPVGRLDYASEGLLLMTNDGALAQKLMKAGSHVPKTYWVKVSGKPEEKAIAKLRAGITIALEDGRRVKTSPAKIRLAQDGAKESGSSASLGTNEWPLEARGKQVASGERANPWYEVTLIEGRNRQIRRMFERVGHHVEKIKRVQLGPLVLDVQAGKFRELTEREVMELKKVAGGGKGGKWGRGGKGQEQPKWA